MLTALCLRCGCVFWWDARDCRVWCPKCVIEAK